MHSILPQELLTSQLEALELVESLFPLDGEITMDDRTAATRRWIEAGGGSEYALREKGLWTDELVFTINVALELDEPRDEGETFSLSLLVRIPLYQPEDGRETTLDGAPYASLNVQQPPWLSRAAHDSLVSFLPFSDPATPLSSFSSNAELVLQTIETVKEEGVKMVPKKEEKPAIEEEEVPEFRVWCWVGRPSSLASSPTAD
jgi:hypothetical protein